MIPWKTASDSVNSCVEVARGDVVWARCAGGDCVEAVRTTGDHSRVLVRDSKEAPDYHVQQWTPREWAELLRALRIDAEHPAVEKLDNGLILLGSGPDQPIQRYTQVEWDAFTRGALKGAFEYEGLPDVGEWIEPSQCKCSKLSGPAEASPGGGPAAGRTAETTPGLHESPEGVLTAIGPGWRPDPAAGAGEVGATSSRPAPVAAEPIPRMVPTTCGRCYPRARCVCRDYDSPAGRPVDASSGVKTSVVADWPGSFDDELDLLYSPAGRLDEDPAAPLGPSLATAPAAGQPGSDSSNTAVTEERPVTDDRSEAGTGALPPAPVPAAEPALDPLTVIAAQIEQEIRTADRQAEHESSDHNDDGASYWYGYGTALEWVLRLLGDEWPHLRDGRAEYRVALAEAGEVWAKLASPIEDANEWAKAVAPPVPTDGAS